MKNIVILGSTGSIGRNALAVAKAHPLKFRVVGLSANSNVGELYRQIKEFRPLFACVNDPPAARILEARPALKGTRIFCGPEGLRELVRDKKVDQVVLAISGADALMPLLEAIENKKDIALANKEALVMAGPLVMQRAAKNAVKVIPIDSEQSAIWQCLDSRRADSVKNVYLTASGGPLRTTSLKGLKNISIKKVIAHPRWKMGKKISVDSATLMNKGLEVLEAMFLFNLEANKIKVVIHPEAIIHSMVEFLDGVVLAQLSVTDMRLPIQYALSYPERLPSNLSGINFYNLGGLHFERPDFKRFPSLGLAYRAAEGLGTLPCVLNAANEVSVNEFLAGRLGFMSIARIVEKVMDRHRSINKPDLEDIKSADHWARLKARKFISEMG